MDPLLRPHARLSYRYLLAWSVTMVTSIALGGPALDDYVWVPFHFAFLGIGFAGSLVAGLGHQVLSVFGGRPKPHSWWLRLERLAMGLAVIVIGLGPLVAVLEWPQGALRADLFETLDLVGGPLVGLAPMSVGGGLLWQIARHRLAEAPSARLTGDGAGWALVTASGTYAVLAGLAAIRHGAFSPGLVHLFLLGHVVCMVYAIASRVFPRFSTKTLPVPLFAALAVLAIAAPILMAGGLFMGARDALLLGGYAALFSGLLFVALVFTTLAHRRNDQQVYPVIGAAASFLLFGMALGIGIVVDPSSFRHLPVHAINNLVGFLSLLILGMGNIMLGVGNRPLGSQGAPRVLFLGLTVAVSLVWWEVATMGILPYGRWAGLVVAGACIVHGAWGLRALPRSSLKLATPPPPAALPVAPQDRLQVR